MNNECITREPVVLYFPTITGEKCYLSFGYNTKFTYRKEPSGKIALTRKNMEFIISRIDFEKLFKIV